MKSLLRSLIAPAAGVVAVHDTPTAARTAVAALGAAGFDATMLAVVGRHCAPAQPVANRRRGIGAWPASGAFWGLASTTLIAGAVLCAPSAAVSPMTLLLVVALVIAVQACVVAAWVAPRRTTDAAWHAPSAAHQAYGQQLAADKLLLVVEGSRSEIALARLILENA